MKKLKLFAFAIIMLSQLSCLAKGNGNVRETIFAGADYKLVVTGFDWGPAVNKVILSMGETVNEANASDFYVSATRKAGEAAVAPASGTRKVMYAYVSNADGKKTESGSYVTLVLEVSPLMPIGSPIQYRRIDGQGRNNWIDYKLTVLNTTTNRVWDTENGRIMPLVDKFDLSGKYKHNDKLTMSYAAYEPASSSAKSPLIIWLHGGGEGGTDPTIPLLGNRAANYASEEIQTLFGGAYVLSPQCPGAWMHNAEGVTQHGEGEDAYNQGLMALIKDYVKNHPKVDPKRIYVGGCSNGGYMALKLILLYPDYFAAGYISALAYQSQYITDTQIQSIKNVPIWFVHSKDDNTTKPDLTVVPVYNRLKTAGAKNLHFTYYDHVTDITGFFGGENYYYNGHWSWVYMHANLSRNDLDGSPVMVNGRPVSIMEWMAAQSK